MEFQEFPPEILVHIASFLSIKDVNVFAQTCFFHYAIVRENDETLRRRYTKATEELRIYNVTPSGNGSVMSFSGRNVVITTLGNGERNGFEMKVLENGDVHYGTCKNGKRAGIWKDDGSVFRDGWSGLPCWIKYDENGLLCAQTELNSSKLIATPTGDKNIVVLYKELPLRGGFRCENTGNSYFYSFVKLVEDTRKGTRKRDGNVGFFYCCKEHQGDMPDDLLCREEADEFL
nr:F-box containing protein [Marseillevirus futianmevirus]